VGPMYWVVGVMRPGKTVQAAVSVIMLRVNVIALADSWVHDARIGLYGLIDPVCLGRPTETYLVVSETNSYCAIN
jgi:hypothetical protein